MANAGIHADVGGKGSGVIKMRSEHREKWKEGVELGL